MAATDENLISITEAAEITGVPRPTLSAWRNRRGDFPPAVGKGKRGDLYNREDLVLWITGQSDTDRDPMFLTVFEDLGRVVSQSGRALFLQMIEDPSVINERRIPSDLQHSMLAQRLLAELRAMSDEGRRDLAEYAVSLMANSRAGSEASTAVRLAEFMVAILGERKSVLDPCIGYGEAASKLGPATRRIAGQDIDELALQVAETRLRSHGAEVDLALGDVADKDCFAGEVFDGVIAEPPAGMSVHGLTDADLRWRFTVPRDYSEAFVQHAISHLASGGRAVLALPARFGFASTGPARDLRAGLVRNGWVRAVIACPPGAAMGSGIRLLLLVLESPSAVPADILFAEPFKKRTGRARRDPWTEEQGDEAAAIIRGVLDGSQTGEFPPDYRVVPVHEVAEGGYLLTPQRFLVKRQPARALEKIFPELDERVGGEYGFRQAAKDISDACDRLGAAMEEVRSLASEPGRIVSLGELYEVIPLRGARFAEAEDSEDRMTERDLRAMSEAASRRLRRPMRARARSGEVVELTGEPTEGDLLVGFRRGFQYLVFEEEGDDDGPFSYALRPKPGAPNAFVLAAWLSSAAGSSQMQRFEVGDGRYRVNARDLASFDVPDMPDALIEAFNKLQFTAMRLSTVAASLSWAYEHFERQLNELLFSIVSGREGGE